MPRFPWSCCTCVNNKVIVKSTAGGMQSTLSNPVKILFRGTPRRQKAVEEDRPAVKRASTLLDELCALLGSPRDLLHLFIQRNRHKVWKFLRNSELTTNYLGFRNREVKFDGISARPASEQYALNGYLKITVQQYMYTKHGQRLYYPLLPCVQVFGNNGHIDYFPLELLNCN